LLHAILFQFLKNFFTRENDALRLVDECMTMCELFLAVKT